MRYIAITVFLFQLAAGLHAQTLATNSIDYDNGDWWNGQSDSAKVFYVHGFRRGMDLGVALMHNSQLHPSGDSLINVLLTRYQTTKTLYFRTASDLEFVKALNGLYAVPSNHNVPTTYMVWVAAYLLDPRQRQQGELLLRGFLQTYRPR